MRSPVGFIVLVALVGATAALGQCFGGERAATASRPEGGAADRAPADLVLVGMATRVVGGDTIKVTLDSGPTTVRFAKSLAPRATAELRR